MLGDAFKDFWHDSQRLVGQQAQLSFDEGVLTHAYDLFNATLRDYQLQGVAWWRYARAS